jgi:phosphatidate cytidylyltransferase
VEAGESWAIWGNFLFHGKLSARSGVRRATKSVVACVAVVDFIKMLVSICDFAQVWMPWSFPGFDLTLLGQLDPNASAAASTGSDVPASVGSKVGLDLPTIVLAFAVLCVLAGASLIARHLTKQSNPYVNPALVQRFVQRLWAWWLMFAILISGMFLHRIGTIVLFGLVSFWAFREFITMAPTRRGDHRALFWSLVVFTPLQYVLIGLTQSGLTYRPDKTIDFYSIYSVMIPVYASLFIPARIAVAGDSKRFLERSAQIQAGLLICVYCLSFAPALLDLNLCTSDGKLWDGSRTGLLFFFILISQLSDVLQWTWGRIRSRRVIAPEISSTRTWDGVLGGSLSTGIFGAILYWVTPFRPWEAAAMAIVVSILGFAGGITMSAIKRDRGVHDYGTLVMGHAGVLDRIDSICFSAPIFYHLTRFFFSVQ